MYYFQDIRDPLILVKDPVLQISFIFFSLDKTLHIKDNELIR